MRRLLYCFFLMILFLCASCSDIAEEPSGIVTPSQSEDVDVVSPETKTIELDLSLFANDIWLDVNSKDTYSFVNMDDASMYAIDLQNNGSKSLDDYITQETLLLDIGDDTILIPDGERKNSGKGSDYGVTGSSQVRIYKIDSANPHNLDDLSIVFNEDDFTADVIDEWNSRELNSGHIAYVGAKKIQFYHVNFNAPAFRDLDRSRIFIVKNSSGGYNMGSSNWGIVTLGKGIVERSGSPFMHMYDFSNVPFINIYHEVNYYFTQARWEECSSERRAAVSKIKLLNPIDLSYDTAVAFGVNDQLFCIPKTSDDSKYILEVDYNLGKQDISLYTAEGDFYDFAYLVDDNTFLIEKISEDVFFDIGLYHKSGGSFSLRKAEPEDLPITIVLDSSGYEREAVITLTSDKNRHFQTFLIKYADGYIPENLSISISALDSDGNPAELNTSDYTVYQTRVKRSGSYIKTYEKKPCIEHAVLSGYLLNAFQVSLREKTKQDYDVTLVIKIVDGSK